MTDNPSLTVRHVHGSNPVRIVLDSKESIEGDLNVLDNSVSTLIFSRSEVKVEGNTEWIKFNEEQGLDGVLEELHKRNLLSVIIEGGQKTLKSFIESGLWDEAHVICSKDLQLNEGLKAPVINSTSVKMIPYFSDVINIYRNK